MEQFSLLRNKTAKRKIINQTAQISRFENTFMVLKKHNNQTICESDSAESCDENSNEADNIVIDDIYTQKADENTLRKKNPLTLKLNNINDIRGFESDYERGVIKKLKRVVPLSSHIELDTACIDIDSYTPSPSTEAPIDIEEHHTPHDSYGDLDAKSRQDTDNQSCVKLGHTYINHLVIEPVLTPELDVVRHQKSVNLAKFLVDSDKEYDKLDLCDKGLKRNGYAIALCRILKKRKSEIAMGIYFNKYASKSNLLDCVKEENELKLIVLDVKLKFGFQYLQSRKINENDVNRFMVILSANDVELISPLTTITIKGTWHAYQHNDVEFVYGVTKMSIDSNSSQPINQSAAARPLKTIISVACDCLSQGIKSDTCLCGGIKRSPIIRIPTKCFGFEKKFDKNSVLILKKLKFWYNGILRYCILAAQFSLKKLGVMYLSDSCFMDMEENAVYDVKNMVKLPNTDHIYGSSKLETKEYLNHIYQQWTFSSQDKLIYFLGEMASNVECYTFNINQISNFDCRMAHISKIDNQLLEAMPDCVNMGKETQNIRLTVAGVVLGHGIHVANNQTLLTVNLCGSNSTNAIHRIIIKKSCYYSTSVWNGYCRLVCKDCLNVEGVLYADQFSVVKIEKSNTEPFLNSLKKKIVSLETYKPKFGDLLIINDKLQTDQEMKTICRNCNNFIQSKCCNNCSHTSKYPIILFEYISKNVKIISQKSRGSSSQDLLLVDNVDPLEFVTCNFMKI